MRKIIFVMLSLSILPVAAKDEACAIKGPVIQWRADYCMFKMETDDIIAADPCMEEEEKRRHKNACAEKRYYKAGMCKMAIANESRKGTVEKCVADPDFMGTTVKNDGVGG